MSQKYRSKSVFNVEGVSKEVLKNHPLPISPVESDVDLLEHVHNRFNSETLFNKDFHKEVTESELDENYSVCSSSYDQYCDQELTQLVAQSFEEINNKLYDGRNSELLTPAIIAECEDWQQKFPHFRVSGTKCSIYTPNDSAPPGDVDPESQVSTDVENSDDLIGNVCPNLYSRLQSDDILDSSELSHQSVNETHLKHIQQQLSNESEENISGETAQSANGCDSQKMYDYIMTRLIQRMFAEVADYLESRIEHTDTTCQNSDTPKGLAKKNKTSVLKSNTSEKKEELKKNLNLSGILSVKSKLLQHRGLDRGTKSLGVNCNGSTIHAPLTSSAKISEKSINNNTLVDSKYKNFARQSSANLSLPPISKNYCPNTDLSTVKNSAKYLSINTWIDRSSSSAHFKQENKQNKGQLRSTSATRLQALPSTKSLPEIKRK